MRNGDDAGGDEVEKGVSSDISPSFAAHTATSLPPRTARGATGAKDSRERALSVSSIPSLVLYS